MTLLHFDMVHNHPRRSSVCVSRLPWKTLNKLGRVQLSPHFFMRDMLYSEIANFHRIQNIPDNPDLAIKAGKKLCNELLEPLYSTFGHVSIRSAYRSTEVNKLGNDEQKRGKKGYSCALDNDARHTWDRCDQDNFMGATACIVISLVYPALQGRNAVARNGMVDSRPPRPVALFRNVLLPRQCSVQPSLA